VNATVGLASSLGFHPETRDAGGFTVVATTISDGFALIVPIAILVVNFWAVTRIIHQAGYSRSWILVPLTPFVLFVAVAVDSVVSIHDFAVGTTTGLSYFTGVGVLGSLFGISVLVTWIFFMVFAYAMAESMFALFKTELFRNSAVLASVGGHWKGLDDLEIETAKWVSWFNEERIHSELDDLSPAEVEKNYADQSRASAA
jgi:hypothetical protein